MATVRDPVCGMSIEKDHAAAQSQHKGQTHSFCSTECKEKFDRQPDQYLGHEKEQGRKSA